VAYTVGLQFQQRETMKTTRVLALLPAMALAACASGPGANSAKAMPQKVGAAVTSPLGDLNLTKGEIPEVLAQAALAPYAYAAEATCVQLGEQVGALDNVLGPDVDAPAATGDKPGLLARGAGAVGNASVSAIKSSAESLVPFRSWVRKLSGAESHARKVDSAIQAGVQRRAFLKGVAKAKGCEPAVTAGADSPTPPVASAASAPARQSP
jgi:hypothetical protein